MSILERLGIPKPKHVQYKGRKITVATVQRQVRIPQPLYEQWETYKQTHPEDSLNGRLLKLLGEFLQLYNVKPPELPVQEAGEGFPLAIDPPSEE